MKWNICASITWFFPNGGVVTTQWPTFTLETTNRWEVDQRMRAIAESVEREDEGGLVRHKLTYDAADVTGDDAPTELDDKLVALQYLLGRCGQNHGNPDRSATVVIIRDLADEILNDHIAYNGWEARASYLRPLEIPRIDRVSELASLVAIASWIESKLSKTPPSGAPIEVEEAKELSRLKDGRWSVEFGEENLYFTNAKGQRYFAKVMDDPERLPQFLEALGYYDRQIVDITRGRFSGYVAPGDRSCAQASGLPCGKCPQCQEAMHAAAKAVDEALKG